jgi:hypothetical protein
MRKRTLLETTWNLIDFTEPNRWLCSMSDDDDGADLSCLPLPSAGYEIDLGADIDLATNELTYHAWIMSDGLMLSCLFLCGIPPEKVKRYIAPWPCHILYVIDTRDVAAYREAHDFQPCNTSSIN